MRAEVRVPPADLNRYQRKHLRDIALDVIARFDSDDAALAARADAARPDGYGKGGTDGGRSSDVSDPTGGAVIARETLQTDHALTAIARFGDAVDMLINADKHRADALPPDSIDPETIDQIWCASCIRIGWHSPRNTNPKDFAQPCTRCTWCAGFRREHKFDPPESILTKRARGGRITTADIDKAVREHRRNRKKKR